MIGTGLTHLETEVPLVVFPGYPLHWQWPTPVAMTICLGAHRSDRLVQFICVHTLFNHYAQTVTSTVSFCQVDTSLLPSRL